ncbi:hypothetical protein OIU79_009311 [Salix purpurea]|uniref:Uncharacterized protein n=1 Tax=Salix purpurea TaxID=77065 RepID=A0A9Q0TKJ2_SALPP|nr:hypothetical protein OIU79_009311 [Salix purpurea]
MQEMEQQVELEFMVIVNMRGLVLNHSTDYIYFFYASAAVQTYHKLRHQKTELSSSIPPKTLQCASRKLAII